MMLLPLGLQILLQSPHMPPGVFHKQEAMSPSSLRVKSHGYPGQRMKHRNHSPNVLYYLLRRIGMKMHRVQNSSYEGERLSRSRV